MAGAAEDFDAAAAVSPREMFSGLCIAVMAIKPLFGPGDHLDSPAEVVVRKLHPFAQFNQLAS
ncbi:hypothetical protein CRES_0556 [Corynebacterium resistens DSM 45100]|uniref:Uncharacterized protein n=1 Tax=Corynebacterium resistens (strain DSM 45100 / JCM 12819 / GTC 2026 / SICGH 158) TaxID=662755 RepID=F8DYS6_CORRG|nr:hypothetical protein CRES_0556 [Corynebacterium resistens DSM 45100]